MADVKTIEIGPNLKAVLLGIIGVAMVVAQVWTGLRANDAARRSEENGSRINRVEKSVLDGRNEHRRSVGLPPVAVPETVTE